MGCSDYPTKAIADFRAVLAHLTEFEARAIYDALAQWADNERNGVEGYSAEELPHGAKERLELVEGIVERLEAKLAELACQALAGKPRRRGPTAGKRARTYYVTLPDGSVATARKFTHMKDPVGYAHWSGGWYLAALWEREDQPGPLFCLECPATLEPP